MRGRKPRPVTLAADDLPRLERIARQVSLPFFQVQRARIVLAIAGGESVQDVSALGVRRLHGLAPVPPLRGGGTRGAVG